MTGKPPEELVQAVLDAVEADAPLTNNELAERLGETRGTVYGALNELLDRGELEREVRVVIGEGQHPYEYRPADDEDEDDRIYDEDGGVIPV